MNLDLEIKINTSLPLRPKSFLPNFKSKQSGFVQAQNLH